MQRYLRDCAVLVPPGRLGADEGTILTSLPFTACALLAVVVVVQESAAALVSGSLAVSGFRGSQQSAEAGSPSREQRVRRCNTELRLPCSVEPVRVWPCRDFRWLEGRVQVRSCFNFLQGSEIPQRRLWSPASSLVQLPAL